MTDHQLCPTCGSKVKLVSSDEGTNYYVPMQARIVALMGGGDWVDASVDHLAIPESMDLDKEKASWNDWCKNEYKPLTGMEYISFSDWLIKHGARKSTEEEVLEYWE